MHSGWTETLSKGNSTAQLKAVAVALNAVTSGTWSVGLYQYDKLDEPLGHWRWTGSNEEFDNSADAYNLSLDNANGNEDVMGYDVSQNVLKDYTSWPWDFICECILSNRLEP